MTVEHVATIDFLAPRATCRSVSLADHDRLASRRLARPELSPDGGGIASVIGDRSPLRTQQLIGNRGHVHRRCRTRQGASVVLLLILAFAGCANSGERAVKKYGSELKLVPVVDELVVPTPTEIPRLAVDEAATAIYLEPPAMLTTLVPDRWPEGHVEDLYGTNGNPGMISASWYLAEDARLMASAVFNVVDAILVDRASRSPMDPTEFQTEFRKAEEQWKEAVEAQCRAHLIGGGREAGIRVAGCHIRRTVEHAAELLALDDYGDFGETPDRFWGATLQVRPCYVISAHLTPPSGGLTDLYLSVDDLFVATGTGHLGRQSLQIWGDWTYDRRLLGVWATSPSAGEQRHVGYWYAHAAKDTDLMTGELLFFNPGVDPRSEPLTLQIEPCERPPISFGETPG